jgi:hypothetical protein
MLYHRNETTLIGDHLKRIFILFISILSACPSYAQTNSFEDDPLSQLLSQAEVYNFQKAIQLLKGKTVLFGESHHDEKIIQYYFKLLEAYEKKTDQKVCVFLEVPKRIPTPQIKRGNKETQRIKFIVDSINHFLKNPVDLSATKKSGYLNAFESLNDIAKDDRKLKSRIDGLSQVFDMAVIAHEKQIPISFMDQMVNEIDFNSFPVRHQAMIDTIQNSKKCQTKLVMTGLFHITLEIEELDIRPLWKMLRNEDVLVIGFITPSQVASGAFGFSLPDSEIYTEEQNQRRPLINYYQTLLSDLIKPEYSINPKAVEPYPISFPLTYLNPKAFNTHLFDEFIVLP